MRSSPAAFTTNGRGNRIVAQASFIDTSNFLSEFGADGLATTEDVDVVGAAHHDPTDH